MTVARRHGPLTAVLMLAGALCGACVTTEPEARLKPPAEVGPAAGESYLALGNRLLSANEPALALKAFTRSISVEGLSAEALTGAGIAARQQGMLGAARRHFQHARDLAPDSAIAHNNLGVALFALKDYDGARAAFRSAVKLAGDEKNEAARRNLERAEAALAALEGEGAEEPAATQRVVRLGTDVFRIQAVAAATGTGPAEEDEAD